MRRQRSDARLDERENATILAALRCWQSNAMRGAGHDLDHIASNGGAVKPLNAEEIDALCERLNLSP